MNKEILLFLETYKKLDELCKQVLSSERGISEYIEEMSNDKQSHFKIISWENDYKQLKKMRWIRNKLVHEPNSFEDNLFTEEDIVWLQNFHSRILECRDPFSLRLNTKSDKEEKIQYTFELEDDEEEGQTWYIVMGVFVGIVILIVTILCFF